VFVALALRTLEKGRPSTASALFQAETLQRPHTAFLKQRRLPGVAVGTYLLPTGTINGFVASIFFAFFKVFFAIFVPPRLIRPTGRRCSSMQRYHQTRRLPAILQGPIFVADGVSAFMRVLDHGVSRVEIITAC
jgi:hypothetical protein